MHVALLGDSTLDNRRYTDGGPAVVDQLEAVLGDGHAVTLVAPAVRRPSLPFE